MAEGGNLLGQIKKKKKKEEGEKQMCCYFRIELFWIWSLFKWADVKQQQVGQQQEKRMESTAVLGG